MPNGEVSTRELRLVRATVLTAIERPPRPEKDGSSSHVAKHSPKAADARSFKLSGEISALQSELGAL